MTSDLRGCKVNTPELGEDQQALEEAGVVA